MNGELIPLFLIAIICFLFGVAIGFSISSTTLNKECIERGVAKYEVSNKGDIKFVWLVEKKDNK